MNRLRDYLAKIVIPQAQAIVIRMIREHEAEVEKHDPEQAWLRQRQWNDIREQMLYVAVLREMLAALKERQ